MNAKEFESGSGCAVETRGISIYVDRLWPEQARRELRKTMSNKLKKARRKGKGKSANEVTLAEEGGSLSYCRTTAWEDSLLILFDGQEKSRENNQSLNSPTKTRERRRKEPGREEGEERWNTNQKNLQREKCYDIFQVFVSLTTVTTPFVSDIYFDISWSHVISHFVVIRKS